ncbi:hypothetical protein [Niallia sp. RD1]|uniref:hypothetical protein n=1 Tax=Niallia sp. RD1 TaxID=2962858 RepID=UPI0020C1A88B|nr:hypothetical protein [Niallia sp. RD1]UTI42237.1 hypothetical protein NKG37_00260 [Niallia sp. RD1]
MNYNEFTNPDNWIGGFYELSIEFHPVGDNNRLNQALIALENIGFFNGLWQERQDFLSDSISLPINIDDDSVNQFYGTLNLTDGNTLPSLISVIRIEGESDWLDISIPQATLEQLYPYEYPLTKELNPWLAKIDEIYIRIAETIYNNSPFELAMIGEEISGYTNQEEITKEDSEKITFILPIRLQKRLGIQDKGEELSKQLRLFR